MKMSRNDVIFVFFCLIRGMCEYKGGDFGLGYLCFNIRFEVFSLFIW